MGRPSINDKPMTAKQRKKAQRAREAGFDIKVVEVKLSKTERAILENSCKVRGGIRGEYDANEYIQTLIRRDAEQLEKQLSQLGSCDKCNKSLPNGCGGLNKGDSECWHTVKALELTL